jgi:hypothetical protein
MGITSFLPTVQKTSCFDIIRGRTSVKGRRSLFSLWCRGDLAAGCEKGFDVQTLPIENGKGNGLSWVI